MIGPPRAEGAGNLLTLGSDYVVQKRIGAADSTQIDQQDNITI
jgi:hypothetical protein